MSKKPKDNSVGAWAKDKLESLRRGLDYYTTRLKNQPHWQQVYIDAFAGPGLSTIRTKPREQGGERLMTDMFAALNDSDPVEEEVEYLKGSPRVALDIQNPFDRYIFIERDLKRLAELEASRSGPATPTTSSSNSFRRSRRARTGSMRSSTRSAYTCHGALSRPWPRPAPRR